MAEPVLTGLWISPRISVARPRNWQSSLLSLILVVGWILVALLIVLVKLPILVVAGYSIEPVLLRLALLCLWYYLAFTFSPLVYGFLPSAPVLWGRSLWLQNRGKRHRLSLGNIDEVDIEVRPRGAIAVLRMNTGLKFELCPLSWMGADALVYRIRLRGAWLRARRPSDPR